VSHVNQRAYIAADGEEFDFRSGHQDWIVSWHPAALPPPDGKRHGSEAVCLTPDRRIVLVSGDGESWSLPGGRPEGDEDWRKTLQREVLEEACAWVESATLLGFAKSVCKRGPEEGLILIRSFWRADVSLRPWDPQHETSHRLLVSATELLARINAFPPGAREVNARVFHESFPKGFRQAPFKAGQRPR